MKKAKISNPQLLGTISLLKKAARENDAKIWDNIAIALFKTRSRRKSINLSRIDRYTQRGQIVAIPGKVLGAGTLHHSVTIAASAFSATAKEKIKKSRGKCMTFAELIAKNPKGSNVKIVG